MQPPAGPSGTPAKGPVGAPAKRPAGAPAKRPAGAPAKGPVGAPAKRPAGPPSEADATADAPAEPTGAPSASPAQFDPLAEIEDARARRESREQRLETLRDKRNRARINVYLFLTFTVLFSIASVIKTGPGNVDDNPQRAMPASEVEMRLAEWRDEDLHGDRIWDGAESTSGSAEKTLTIVGVDLGEFTKVRVDVKVASWREDAAASTDFTAGVFPEACESNLIWNFDSLDSDAVFHSNASLAPGEVVEFRLKVAPGKSCFFVKYDEPIPREHQRVKATLDAEVRIHWTLQVFVPFAVGSALLSLFAFIGAFRIGRQFKRLKYPEGKPEKKIEEEVLEEAEAARKEHFEAPEVPDEGSDSAEPGGPTLAEAAASPDQGEAAQPAAPSSVTQITVNIQDSVVQGDVGSAAADAAVESKSEPEAEPEPAEEAEAEQEVEPEPEAEPEPAEEVETAPESTNPAAAYTDEQLLASGWTQEHVDALREGRI